VLRRADLALAGARASGPGCVRRYDDATRDEQDRLGALRDDLGHALERRELRLVYQPVVDLALHRVTGMEALMRWQHPRYGAVSPADFIPLAEESQLVVDLGRWALQEACTMLAGLPSDEQTVAVNIAPRHLRSGTLVPDVLGALHRSGLAPTRLVLEITESVLLDASGVVDDLAALRRLGIRVAVDDFGTGWSSLARLVNLPVDVLKMDRSFLSGLGDDPQRRALCRAVLELGNILGLSVIVEGVETPMEQSLLQNMGHRYLQGYLLGRPMEQVDLVGHLQAGGAAPSGQLPPAGRTS
jgi:EAL domain-containing protein (putative c-di-GMP-specific phosphodiesterase class I)